MRNFEGYLKQKFGDSYILLAGGGHKALSDIFTNLSRPSNTNNISITVGGVTKSITLGSNAWSSDSYHSLNAKITRNGGSYSWYSFQQYNSNDTSPSYYADDCAIINIDSYSGWLPWIRGTGSDKASWCIGQYTTNLWIARIDKSNTKNELTLSWLFAADGSLKATKFIGALLGNADTASDSAKLNGYASDTAPTANTIVRRQANGYIYAVYYNASNSTENISSYTAYPMFKDSNGWQRCTTKSYLQSWLGLGDRAYDSTSYLPLAGGTMTGHITMSGLEIYFGKAGANAILSYSSSFPKYGIWYNDTTVDLMMFSASNNADDASKADLAINGNGDGTVTIRGNTIIHVGNYTSYCAATSHTHPLSNITSGTSSIAVELWGWRFYNAYNGSSKSDIYLGHGGGYGAHIRGYSTSASVYLLQVYNSSAELFGVYADGRVHFNGNVGLSTTSPSCKLHVVGKTLLVYNSTSASDPILNILNNTFASASFCYATNTTASALIANSRLIHLIGKANGSCNLSYFGYHHVADGSTSNYATIGLYGKDELLNVLASGNVGIGTTAPGYKLEVNGSLGVGDTTIAGTLTFSLSSTARTRGIIGTYDPNRAAAIWAMGSSYQIKADGTTFGSLYGAAYAYFGSGYTFGAGYSGGHSMVWCQNGGIYAALGNYIWSKNGYLKDGSSNDYFLLGGGGHVARSDYASASHSHSYLPLAGGTMTGGINLNRYLASNGTGIEFYSSSYNSWLIYMHAAGSSQTAGWNKKITTVPSGTYVTSWALRSVIEGGSGYGWTWESMAASGVSPSIVMELASSSGNLKTIGSMYAANFYTTSDQNKKKNIQSISSSLPLVSFNWKKSGEKSYGFIALELQKKYPELVDGEDGSMTVNYNAALSLCVAILSNKVTELENEIKLLKKGKEDNK